MVFEGGAAIVTYSQNADLETLVRCREQFGESKPSWTKSGKEQTNEAFLKLLSSFAKKKKPLPP